MFQLWEIPGSNREIYFNLNENKLEKYMSIYASIN